MTFFTSVPPDITESLPFTLSARTVAAEAVRTGFLYDYFVNGVGFNRYPSGDTPYRRTSIPVQKQQTDVSNEAGEQSLDGYWTRSQVSWHRGAGIVYYEPGAQDETKFRYHDGQGVDVWNEGAVTLLKDTDNQFTVTGSQEIWATSAVDASGTDLLILNHNSVVKRWDGTTTTSYTMGSGSALTAVAVAGNTLLWGNATGIWSGSISGTTCTQLWSQASGALVTPYWVKSRIIAAQDASLYELTLAGGTLPPATPLYTHPAPGWTWTSVTESPTAILAAGNAAGSGAIYRFGLQDATSGQTPKLSQAYQVAELPPGEQVYAIKVYLGKFLGVGTSKGVRIGVLDADSNLQIGPLLVHTAKPVRSLTAAGSFMVAGVEAGLPDGRSGALKVNLGEPIGDSLQFAYAWDAATQATGKAGSIAYLGNSDRLCVCVTSSGAWVQNATRYVSSGWATSGRMRFNTSDPKLFRLATGEGGVLPGTTIEVYSVRGETQDETLLSSMTAGTGTGYEIGMAMPEPATWAQLKVVLRSDVATGLLAPFVRAFQVKALPDPSRIRRISIPLAACDFDRDRNGATFGADGYGWSRLMALEEAEESGQVVPVKDTITGDAFNAMVEQIDFQWSGQASGNHGGLGSPPMSGVASVVLRKL